MHQKTTPNTLSERWTLSFHFGNSNRTRRPWTIPLAAISLSFPTVQSTTEEIQLGELHIFVIKTSIQTVLNAL